MSKVLLIGLDGATFTVLDRLIAEGVTPFIGELQQRGARAALESVVPPLTPPAWTSLMTGRSPGHHGIFDFFFMDSPKTRHIRFATSNDVRCETIWARASDAGLKTTVLNFPLMFPAPKISGVVIPGWVPWRQLRLACWPADLFERLTGVPGFEPRELAMDMHLEEKATEGCADAELEAWVDLHIRRERNWFDVLTHLMATEPCPLTAVIFDGTDRLQHLCWRFIDTERETLESDLERRLYDRVRVYFRELDQMLRSLVESQGQETMVLIASDHGFGPTRAVFHVNAWLASRGYLTWSPTVASSASPQELLGVGQVARHTFQIDWDHTRVFATTPTSNGLYIVAAEDGPAGVSAMEYESFRRCLMDELRELVDPATGEPLVADIAVREEAFAGPCAKNAPDLTLRLFDGGLMSILPADTLVTQRPTVAGAHRPAGVFLAVGPGISAGTRLERISILDIAPLVLHGLGLAVPIDLEGQVPEAIFESAALAARPVQVSGRSETFSASATPAPTMGPAEEAALMERLRQLGYVE